MDVTAVVVVLAVMVAAAFVIVGVAVLARLARATSLRGRRLGTLSA